LQQFVWLIADMLIVLAFIAGPWVIFAKLGIERPGWLQDGIALVVLFVIWAGIALFLATQTILWLGFVP
jgi:hypothetical protein